MLKILVRQGIPNTAGALVLLSIYHYTRASFCSKAHQAVYPCIIYVGMIAFLLQSCLNSVSNVSKVNNVSNVSEKNSHILSTRACCREEKIPNQYGGVIL